MPPNDVAIRKRSQIASANRTMFIWIAVASVVVGSALVVSYFLLQKLILKEKVLGEQQNTAFILAKNNVTIKDLQSEVKVLDTNTDLASIKANPNDRTIQVILDALPSDANSLALGASLQNKLLSGIPGLTIETLNIDPVQGVEKLDNSLGSAAAVAATDATANEITFQFTVSGNQTALKQVLVNLERSIRTIDVKTLKIETQNNKQVMTVSARAFYEPSQSLELMDKKVKL